jgi:hypothetical protein
VPLLRLAAVAALATRRAIEAPGRLACRIEGAECGGGCALLRMK